MSLTDANMSKIREFKDSFCLYAPVREVLADLESLYQSAEIGGDQLSMLLCGDTGTGKSALIRYFSETKNQNQSESLPILLSRVPSKLTVEDTTRQLLGDLGVFGSSSHRYKNTQSDAHLTSRLLDALRVKNTKLIIINEFQELIEFKGARDRQAIGNRLKLISEEAGVPIVLAGMPWIDEILNDSQWASRLATRRHTLNYLSLSKRPKEYNELLKLLEQSIPCEVENSLTEFEISLSLFAASCGEIRQLKALLTEAIKLCLISSKPLTKQSLSDSFKNLYPGNENPFDLPKEKIKIREVEMHSQYIRGDSSHRASIEPRRLSEVMTLTQILSKK
ncbi:MAG: TniB family NTP-binding protein [Gammaproteobacteria bacterium]|nr:TniB family NTP-binding protein [Gammaproteobacteria bacterium]MBU1467320.1 TniB family NTP-binding protein [Gammaproteobacteria bacterium]MBU2021838.1 TniB family NTP-binding protein [Gammaproteobacteria bacterium]MBU2237375.1 TniB family NTP-binding protein [Gammaproteobacteria bacterium]MBU2320355.1 TniB family NTP-binding protein [Gammaproteobacteria bacterium]